MTGTILERSLQRVAQRLHKLRILRRQALCWMLLLVPAIAAALLLPPAEGFLSTELFLLLGVTVAGLWMARWRLPEPSAIETARLVEKSRPELNDAVITAVQADARARTDRRASVMDEWVIDEADKLAHKSNWQSVIPGRQMVAWSILSFLGFSFLVSSVVAAGRWGRDLQLPALREELAAAAGQTLLEAADLTVEPGDVEVERGTSLTVVARFGKGVPAISVLEVTTEAGVTTSVMDPTVDEGVFAATIGSVPSDGSYRVVFGESDSAVQRFLSGDAELSRQRADASIPFAITTYVRPRVEQVDAVITPPEYTGRPPQVVEDTLRVTAVEGSDVEFQVHVNKRVAVAELITGSDLVIPLDLTDAQSGIVTAHVQAVESEKYRIVLRDDANRTAAEEPSVTLNVVRNQRPKIQVTFPGRDTNVSPLQEFHVEAETMDDFGIEEFGIRYTLSNGRSGDVSLLADLQPGDSENGPTTSRTAEHVILLEELQAEPDQLLSYSFYVRDYGPDGQLRVTNGDIQLAEVRRFEEIFRESDQNGQQQQQQRQQQQQQGQQGQQSGAEQLMELQKEILVATFNTGRTLQEAASPEAVEVQARKDVGVIVESQQQALEQLQEQKQEATDAESMELIRAVETAMDAALIAQGVLQDTLSDEALQSALAAEQTVLAGLMKMRAREFEVQQQQQQQQGQGQGQSQASRQQMQQLELNNDQQRYESEREARQQQEQNAANSEQLQILNRLKELARRQQMLNERLKQLESELRAAQTEEEKDEIQRELKRLREEQRDLLRDVDELRETMDSQSAEQQQQNQETREQVEQARDRVQQASRAMDDGQLSEAISEGTRAEREFEDLQEKFRQQTANQFSEAMQDLRQQTREMKDQQEQIARELAGETPEENAAAGQAPSLRTSDHRADLQQKVAEQRDNLERVLERAKDLVEQAEESEPLLSRRLYDTVRDVREKKPETALEATELLVGRGLYQQGQQAEQIAREGINELAEGIENAADAVLGSEAESLRRAQQELESLTQQLSSEVAEATGQQPGQTNGQTPAERQPGQASGDPNGGAPGGEPSEEQASGTPRQAIQRAPRPSPQQRAAESDNATEERRPQDGQPGDSQGRQPGAGPNGQESGERQPGEQQPDGQQPGGQQTNGQQPGGQQPDGQQPGGQQPDGQQPDGQQPGGQQPGGQQPGGQQPGGQQPGGQQPDGQQPGGQQPGGQEPGGQQPGGQQPGGQQPGGQQPGGQQPGGQQPGGRGRGNNFLLNGGRESVNGGTGNNSGRPLTGEDYREWSNRMREVEEILDDPELRNQVAQVRDRARSIRAEFRRHGKEPQWDLVQSELLNELQDLQSRINQQISRLSNDRSMVPIDREPVPEEFDELVRRYYELLGQSQEDGE